MKKNYILTTVTLICLALSMVIFTACDDDDEKNSGQVELLSFGPSGVKHGDEIVFIGKNLDQVSSIVFQPGVEVGSASFTSVTADRITVAVPKEAEAGLVVLKTSAGEIQSKTILNFEVPVVISGITSEAKPGTDITITGDLINWIESVTFPGDVVVEKEDFVSQSLTELVVTVPMEAKTGFLIFSTGGTEPLTFGFEEVLTVSLPTVESLTPGSVRHEGELTITGTNLDLVTSVVFYDDIVVNKANFISQSETEIKLQVPRGVIKGTITLTQPSLVDVTTTDELIITLPVGTSISPTPAVPGQDEITITGTDFDLVEKLVLPGAGEVAKAAFTSHTPTEIKLAVPETATQGAIEFITIHDYRGGLGLVLKLPSTGGTPILDYYIYKDGLQNGWEAWGGWGHVSQEYNNADNPLAGTTAIKTVFSDQWGAIQIHNSGATNVFDGYNYLVFYVYVQGEDSDIIAQIDNNGDFYPPHFTKDKYHQIVVPLADLAGSDNVSELRIKNNNPVDDQNTIVFIDEIGLTIDPPLGLVPELAVPIFGDAIQNGGFQQWGGWGSETVWDDSENVRGGEKSIKVTYNAGNWSGGAQLGAGNLPTSGSSFIAFSVFGGPGTDGKKLQLLAKSAGGEATQQVTIQEGKWADFKIALSDLGNPTEITEMFFQNADFTGTVWIDNMGLQ